MAKTMQIRSNERCIYHWHADATEAPGYVHHALVVTYKDGHTGEFIKTATEYVVSHSVTGNYAYCGDNVHPIFSSHVAARRAVGIEAIGG